VNGAQLVRRWAALGCALTATALPACALDHRSLRPGESADAGRDARPDREQPPSGGGVHVLDGAAVDYSEAGKSHEAGPPKEQDAGPCVHHNDQGVLDCGETLLKNADFNRSIAEWKAAAGAQLKWVNVDAQDQKSSGALAVRNAEQGDYDGTVGVAAAQCLPAETHKTYDYAASMFIRRGQAFGEGQILVFFYGSEDCSGLVSSAYAVTQVESTEKWMRASGSLNIPEGVRSMGVRLQVEKPFRSEILEVLFDAVRVNVARLPM
jgi:hypothetical protein